MFRAVEHKSCQRCFKLKDWHDTAVAGGAAAAHLQQQLAARWRDVYGSFQIQHHINRLLA